jgi:hypothetical protein
MLVEENEHFTVILPKGIDRAADLRPELDRLVGGSSVGLFVQIIREFRTLGPPSGPCAAAIDRNAEKPRAERP